MTVQKITLKINIYLQLLNYVLFDKAFLFIFRMKNKLN
jgi:hypothetical protein